MNSIAVVLRVGRPTARRVVRELADSIARHRHDFGQGDCHLYLSIDREKSDAITYESLVDVDTESVFRTIRLINHGDRQQMARDLTRFDGVSCHVAEAIALRQPYSDQLNSAIICALMDGNDAAVFLDDDVSLAVPVEASDGAIAWRNMDVVGWHLRALKSGASVSTGRVVGFLSPIQPALVERLSPELVLLLGELFTDAHEFLSAESFDTADWQVLTAAQADDAEIRVVEASRGYRWITPANLGIDLRSDFPLFFNPPGARGEDAFFGMALPASARVAAVPGTVFHDPFLTLPEAGEPTTLDSFANPPLTSASVDRFAAAVFGWVAYMPLFLKVSRGIEGSELSDELASREVLVRRASEALKRDLELLRFTELGSHFRWYCDRVDQDYGCWREANDAWRTFVKPKLVTRT